VSELSSREGIPQSLHFICAIILPVVLYGCETWSLTLTEHRLELYENRVLRRIFGAKREEKAA
jgi:hypothetical protein